MKLCKDHASQLIGALTLAGLGDLISGDAGELLSRLDLHLQDHTDPKGFDPFFGAHALLTSMARHFGDPIPADGCVLCYQVRLFGDEVDPDDPRFVDQAMIDMVVAKQLEAAAALGLRRTQ